MRDVAATIEALERKAACPTVTSAERDALLSKAEELRAQHEPELQTAMPPRQPPTTPPAPPGYADGWQFWRFDGQRWTTTTSGTNTTSNGGSFTTTITFG